MSPFWVALICRKVLLAGGLPALHFPRSYPLACPLLSHSTSAWRLNRHCQPSFWAGITPSLTNFIRVFRLIRKNSAASLLFITSSSPNNVTTSFTLVNYSTMQQQRQYLIVQDWLYIVTVNHNLYKTLRG